MRFIVAISILIAILVFGVGTPVFGAGYWGLFLNWGLKINQNTQNSSFNPPNISNQEMNLQKNMTSSDYIGALIKIWESASFSEENFNQIKKDKNGRILSVEELALKAETIGISEEYKRSFRAWRELDDKVIEKLKTEPIDKKYSDAHKSMLRWYKYHAEYAGKLAKDDLSREQIKKLNEDYARNAKYYIPSLHRKLTETIEGPEAQFVLWKNLINNARAIAGSPYFGGLIFSYSEFCLSGFSFIVIGTQGGWMWIYYATMAIGGRMNYVIIPSGYILGRSLPIPGVCARAGVDTHPSGIAVVYLYGSSL